MGWKEAETKKHTNGDAGEWGKSASSFSAQLLCTHKCIIKVC